MSSAAAVVILAGGKGRRMGGRKPLREIGGRRLIDLALDLARSWSDCVAIAVRDGSQVAPVDAQLISDDEDIEGPLAGLIAGLRYGRSQRRELLLTIPADMPFLPGNLPDRLAFAIAGKSCAMTSSGGHIHPVCALWRTSVLGSAEEYAAGGGRSLTGIAALVGFEEVEWPLAPCDPFFNVNDQAGLLEAEHRAAT